MAGTAVAPTPTGEVWPGWAYPLGATYDGMGTNFAIFSEVAERIELCLFDADDTESRVELSLPFEHARPTAIVTWMRQHWGIENSLH